MKNIKFSFAILILLIITSCRFNEQENIQNGNSVSPAPAVPEEKDVECRDILPGDTDANIQNWNEAHYICTPQSPDKIQGKLFVFLPGTTATPHYYTYLLQTAAESGVYAIGLRYPNDESVNLQLCPRDKDPNCHENVRTEIISGEENSKHVDVDPANSIEGRLASALSYLGATYPSEGWEQFTSVNGETRWEDIIVSGHSQGGGHAVYLAKEHYVHRAIAFAWVDIRKGEIAPWLVNNPSATPPENYYLFWHQDDDLLTRHDEKLMVTLGIDSFGPSMIVEENEPPYSGSHSFVAITPPPADERAHNTHVVDKALNFDAEGNPIHKDVWHYLLTLETNGTVPNTSSQPETNTINATQIGSPEHSYIDPEFHSSENLITFADSEQNAWLSEIDPLSGDFVLSDGRDVLVDEELTPLSLSFNGPEFGIDKNGWSLYYTKDVDGVPQVWQAAPHENKSPQALTNNEISRFSVLASEAPTLDETYLLYAQSSFSPLEGKIAWLNEDGIETTAAPTDRGTRWIDDTASFVYIQYSGANAGQVAIYDTQTHTSETITNSTGKKSYAYGWFAPEYDQLLGLVLNNTSEIEIYQDKGGEYWEKISTLQLPTESQYSIIGSPETFSAGEKSYITLVTKADTGYAKAEVWVWGIETDEKQYTLRCEDDQGEVIRTDPESFVGEDEVFVYYNVFQPGFLGRQKFELYRCNTGITP